MEMYGSLSGSRVLVTGHTGFKGTWLIHTLKQIGVEVFGISLPIGESNRFYNESSTDSLMQSSLFVDLANFGDINSYISEIAPDYVFHLAAQPIVGNSYKDPIGTFRTNILGTSYVLAQALRTPSIKGLTIAATDKVYRNLGTGQSFTENDPLGGIDPYSASKAATEIVIESLARACNPHNIPVTTIRAGNVIGGGDYTEGRLIPDILRTINSGEVLEIRNPNSTRPWQYVTDCLGGYLKSAVRHLNRQSDSLFTSYNIGPQESIAVEEVVRIFIEEMRIEIPIQNTTAEFQESSMLSIDSSLARKELNWEPRFNPDESVRETAKWYSKALNGMQISYLIQMTLEKDFAID